MKLVYSSHALDMLVERDIDPHWVETTVAKPDFIETDPIHPDRTRAFRALPDSDGRVLRVVYVRSAEQVRVITMFLDRGQRRKR